MADTTTTLVFERDPCLNRLLVVANAVFAISLTLLAMELALPQVAAGLQGGVLLPTLLES